jgi:hypothetical protein
MVTLKHLNDIACLVFLRQGIGEIQHVPPSFAILNIYTTYRPNVYTPDIKRSFFKKKSVAEHIKNITVDIAGERTSSIICRCGVVQKIF